MSLGPGLPSVDIFELDKPSVLFKSNLSDKTSRDALCAFGVYESRIFQTCTFRL